MHYEKFDNMKHCFFYALLLSVMYMVYPPEMQARKKDKTQKEETAVKVTLYLNGNVKSGESVVNGYLRSAMANDPEFFEVSDTPDGVRVRYISEDVDSLTVMDNMRYVKRKCRGTGVSATPKIRWVRVFSEGRGIDVYSAYFVTATKFGNTTLVETSMNYYISLSGDIAIYVESINCDNPYYTGIPDAYPAALAYYFGKIYGYHEFAERIKAKEFGTLADVVKAWENEWSEYPVMRDGKLKESQIGVQKNILAESASKGAGRKRMKNEVVFAKHTRNVSAGVSADVAKWSRHIGHNGDNYKLYVPPVGVYADICFADFSRFGSIGYVFGMSYSRFGYDWQWDNGYGPKVQDTMCNRFDVEAGLSWHITVCRNFEAYVRAMADLAVIGDRTVERETGNKNSSASNFNTYVSFAAAGGLRYYFSKNFGIYAEGGYDIGYASAGLTFKF